MIDLKRSEWLTSHALGTPGKVAVVMATGVTLNYENLDLHSGRIAYWLRESLGLRRGDHIALMMINRPELFEAVWAAQRSGLYYTVINPRLTEDESAYMINDSQARVFLTDDVHAELAVALMPLTPGVAHRVSVGTLLKGHHSYEELVSHGPRLDPSEEIEGSAMLYSSGTTGRPKGVKRPLGEGTPGTDFGLRYFMERLLGMSHETVYLSPAPPYHAASLNFCTGIHRLGGTAVVMSRFDPEEALRLIEEFKVTHAQFVPTMFSRMLKLPDAVKTRYNLRSLKAVVHAAAPCPLQVKRRMLEWWGPIIYEYYSGTERNGVTFATPQEWIAHPGTVGRPVSGTLQILNDAGDEVANLTPGGVYFADGPKFSYHNDPEKTGAATDPHGRTTIGDIGYVDDDGFLYLTDRKSYMIIRGGVNIYAQEVENHLIMHPSVDDVAVFGIQDEDLGQEVRAVVQVATSVTPSPLLEQELIAYCKKSLATFKCPKTIGFVDEMPRSETGKLMKRLLMECPIS